MVYKVRKQLGLKKVGHAGTLDPLAEGVLIVLTDNDTKKQNEFMSLAKEYRAEIGFGIFSETYDLEFKPKITRKVHIQKLERDIEKVLRMFLGKQEQVVPAYSAVSVKGQRLYKLARKGTIPTELPSKEIEIFAISLDKTGSRNIETQTGVSEIPIIQISVRCSSGTYIRSLVRDIGKQFGTDAVMLSLIRTKIGDFAAADSINLYDIRSVI